MTLQSRDISFPLLSICIPVYNRVLLFEQSLRCAIKAASGYEDLVEIVVSDNASTEPICDVVQHLASENPGVVVRYSVLSENRGMAANFLEVVRKSAGTFCWIVGSDDFVLASGVRDILGIIRNQPNIDFISIGFDSINLRSANAGGWIREIEEGLPKEADWQATAMAHKISKACIWDELVDPKFENVMLGSVMANVFRRTLWLSVTLDEAAVSGAFSRIHNTYPHCYVFSKAFVGRQAWYHGKACIVAGDGVREWATDSGSTLWQSSLPVIYLKVLDEIVDEYASGGLQLRQVRRCRRWVGGVVGRWFVPYMLHRHIRGGRVKTEESISAQKMLSIHWSNLWFYMGIVRWLVRPTVICVRQGWQKALAMMPGLGRK